MKVLVTGGAGFIGSHVCDHLVESGRMVIAADNFLLGTIANIAHLVGRDNFKFEEMDVTDTARLSDLIRSEGVDCVFHLAANSDIARSRLDPAIDLSNTFTTTYSVLEAMRANGVRQIVFASTSAVYGEAPGRIREDYGPLLPISHYGAAKLASEGFISSYSENYSINTWIARFPNVVGERATHGAVYDFVKKLRKTPDRLEVLGDGTQVKPYLHVSDLVTALILAWTKMSARVNLFNVGGATRATVKRIAEIVVQESGRHAEICYLGGDRGWIGDVPSVDYDTGRISAIGWSPKIDSEGAVRKTARWLFEHSL